jgi:predicted Zn-dependent protease
MEPTHDNAVVQEIDVSTIVEEAARQLREMAEARGAVASGVVPVVVGWP